MGQSLEIVRFLLIETMAPSQPTVVVSDNNEGPVVNIAAWLGMTVMIIGVFTRIGSKFSIVRKWTVDDTIIFVTMVCFPESNDI